MLRFFSAYYAECQKRVSDITTSSILKWTVYITKSRQRYDKTFNNILLHVPNHTLKDMYMLNYETINNTNNLYYNSVEVLIDFIDSVVAKYIFLLATPFFTSASNYGRMNFHSESCRAISYSIHFQPLVAQWFLWPDRLIFKWFFF